MLFAYYGQEGGGISSLGIVRSVIVKHIIHLNGVW